MVEPALTRHLKAAFANPVATAAFDLMAVLALLGVPLTYGPVAEAIGKWAGMDLELAAAGMEMVMPIVRTLPEFLAEPQYTDVLANLPLIEVTRLHWL